MREMMAQAEVDDDVLGKDPTVDRLERRVATLLGKDQALFFPTGTQANQAALLLHTRPGTEALCEAEAHIYHYEMAAAAMLAGVQLLRVPSEHGRVDPEAVESAIRPGDRLTTSSLRGHAMRTSDDARSDGAVLGKAMTELTAGEGLVLVLVNLQ